MVVPLGGGGGLPYVGPWGFSDFLRKWEFHVAVEARYHRRPLIIPTNNSGTVRSQTCAKKGNTNFSKGHEVNNFETSSWNNNSKQIDTFECIFLLSSSASGDNKPEGRTHLRRRRPYPHSPLQTLRILNRESCESLPTAVPLFSQGKTHHQLEYHYHRHHHKERDWHNREEITLSKYLPQSFSHFGKKGEEEEAKGNYSISEKNRSRLVFPTSSDQENNNGLIWNGLVAQNALRNTLRQ